VLPFAEWLSDAEEIPTATEMKTKADELILVASTAVA